MEWTQKITEIINAQPKHPQIEDIVNIGNLYVPTGKIIACDPLYDYAWDVPLLRQIPVGNYPVRLYFVESESWGYRVALAELRIATGAIVSWEMATQPGENVADLEPDHIYGYVVEAGMGCFADAESFVFYTRKIDKLRADFGKDFNHYNDYVEKEMEKKGEYDFLDLQINPDQPHNVISFSSGAGDGLYASYWGLDAQGNVACLVTDFGFLDEDDENK
jgi:hypothetical protein